jgi:predicted RNA binding protein YcfA (HicA-like mRNA interferase family)
MHSSITRQSASKMLLKHSVFQPKFNDTTEKNLTPGTINSILKEASMKIRTK